MQDTTPGFYQSPDLTNCSQEPIHIIGSIQSYGYVLVINRKSLEIVQVSENIENLLGTKADKLVHHTIDEYFSFEFLEYIQNLVKPDYQGEAFSLSFTHNSQPYILSTHLSDGYLVLQIEKDDIRGRENSYFQYANLVDNFLTEIDRQDNITDACQCTIERLREITGYNRIMVYFFDDENNGEVLAEVKEEQLSTFMGLKFPATDIPEQARRLYLKNPARGIWDVNDTPSPIYPRVRKEDQKPLDLSRSFLRSVSPIHVAYLKNMHVRASFSTSLIIKGKLWGMILCHHTEKPVRLNVHQRRACEFISKVLSHNIESKLEENRYRSYKDKLHTLHRLIGRLNSNEDLPGIIAENQEELLSVFDANSYALHYKNTLTGSATIDKKWLKKLMTKIMQHPANIIDTHNLAKDLDMEAREEAAGALVIKLSTDFNEALILLRPEIVQEINWAGKPQDGPVKQLTPRNSFEQYSQSVKGQSRKWQSDEKQFASELRVLLVESILTKDGFLKTVGSDQKPNNDLNLRLAERIRELEKTNHKLTLELQSSHKSDAKSRMAQTMAEERLHVHPLKKVNKENFTDAE